MHHEPNVQTRQEHFELIQRVHLELLAPRGPFRACDLLWFGNGPFANGPQFPKKNENADIFQGVDF